MTARSPLPPSPGSLAQPPYLKAPEGSRSIFLVLFACACAPLASGIFFFGWRAVLLTTISVLTCVFTEAAYYRVTRMPSLLGRTHSALTGLLLALTLPPFVPWYVPVVGGVFAIVIGKAIFGGVGHFLWQPALVGRLAVAVIFAPPLWNAPLLDRADWPVLAFSRVVAGDVTDSRTVETTGSWRDMPAPGGADAIEMPPPRQVLRELTSDQTRPPHTIADQLQKLPAAWDMIVGAYGGGIGETCSLVVLCAGLYLLYRNYASGYLPAMMILSAAATAALFPVRTGDGDWRWLPIFFEGWDVGLVYVIYQLLAGGLMLAAWFLGTEMTSRPVTVPAQAIFGLLGGFLGMLLALYTSIPIPFYTAVLICNTFTPALDVVRPRVLGQRHWWQRRKARAV